LKVLMTPGSGGRLEVTTTFKSRGSS
jgi:hypothetical protein